MHLHLNSVVETENGNTGEKSLEIIPAVNVFNGMPMARGEEGYEHLMDGKGANIDIEELIDELAERFDKALITDINGITKDKPQLELLKKVSSKMKFWVDAGPRNGDCAIDILITGIEKIVVGTKTLRDLEELKNAIELSENVILGIDYDDGIVSPKTSIKEMSPLRLAEEAKSVGIKEIIFTDLNHLASLGAFSIDVGSTLLDTGMKIYFHGRFKRSQEMPREQGLAGVITEVETQL